MCLKQEQQEHKSRFNDTNPEIQKKKKKKAINQIPAKSTTKHLNHRTSTTKQHSTNQTTDHQQTLEKTQS